MVSVSPQAPTPVVVKPRTWRVLLIEPSSHLVRYWLEQAGHETLEVSSLEQALSLLQSERTVVCIDENGGGKIGHQVLKWIQTQALALPVVLVGRREPETDVSEGWSGVRELVRKPFDRARLLYAVERAAQRFQNSGSTGSAGQDIVEHLEGVMSGRSAAMTELEERLAPVLSRDVAVCLLGESGTGKALVAERIHRKSARHAGPFLRVDCSALDPSEHELSLFGDARDPSLGVPGALELASGGTLLVSHVGLLSPRAQALLSATLASRKVRRVGGSEDITVNVRIITAHAGSLRGLVENLRDDLYFRVVNYPVHVPALRERGDDIPLLASFFLRQLFPEEILTLSPDDLDALRHYPWPGNLRELEQVLHQAGLRARLGVIDLTDLPRALQSDTDVAATTRRPRRTRGLDLPDNEVVPLKDLERRAIEHALQLTHGNVTLAARQLGIGRATLYRRLAHLGLV